MDSTNGPWRFHELTKHTVASVRGSAHRLDWDNQPRPYKRYVRAAQIALPNPALESDQPALAAIAGACSIDADHVPDAALISAVLQLSAGITKWLTFPGGRMPFRAAACTGALYHIDLYLVCRELAGIPAGVYHHDVESGNLTVLRAGDYRAALAEAAACQPAPAFLVLASTYWRNAWKYESRAWRHCFWDSGTILANLLAVANAHHLPAQVLSAFVDDAVNRLLGLDPDREAALAVVPLGSGGSVAPQPPPVTPLDLKVEPYSAFEVDYPLIREAQRASALGSVDAVRAWREQALPVPLGEASASLPLPMGQGTVEQSILRRGSARRFVPAAIGLDELEAVLAPAEAPIAADFPALTRPYLILNGVDGLGPGAYRGLRDVIRIGSMRLEAGHLALDQRLAADAAVNVYFMAWPRLGERGYRAAQLDGSIRGGRVYLAAYTLGLAATGLTFYDDEVSELFETSEQVTFLVALGHRGPRQ